jgi:hypothetical protein
MKHIFRRIAEGVGGGSPVPVGWQVLSDVSLIIIVGTTGVGKSTTTLALADSGLFFTLLPNRRILTDQLIIAPMQDADGHSGKVLNRIERFEYARRYREQFAGGMAEVLTQLSVDPGKLESLLVFDGLRGENEVRHAATNLPNARFVFLGAPEWVRFQRLLNRQDVFDQITQATSRSNELEVISEDPITFASLGVPEACTFLTSSEEKIIIEFIERGVFSKSEVSDKLKILVKERLNYDPVTTKNALCDFAPERSLIIDTTQFTPQEIAKKIIMHFHLTELNNEV